MNTIYTLVQQKVCVGRGYTTAGLLLQYTPTAVLAHGGKMCVSINNLLLLIVISFILDVIYLSYYNFR